MLRTEAWFKYKKFENFEKANFLRENTKTNASNFP